MRPVIPPEFELQPWVDEVTEMQGHWPRSDYIEERWLPRLGPSATWLYRRLGQMAIAYPKGVLVDSTELAKSIGLGEGLGANSQLSKSMGRLMSFHVARWNTDAYEVRRALWTISTANVREMPLHRLKY